MSESPQHQLQQTSFNSNDEESFTNQTRPKTIVQHNRSFLNCFSGFWSILIFFSLIFFIICGFVSYQLTRPSHEDFIQELQDHYIPDEPFKQGDQTTQTYDLVKLNTTTALCLDGSPGSYYESRTGDPSRILILFEGGGWCYGKDQQSTLKDCRRRSKWIFGSSKPRASLWTVQKNILSKHPDNEFRNWKKIQINYCDGSGHQGTKKDPVEYKNEKLFFRGYNITTSIFDELNLKFRLFTQTKKIVLTGYSAGGLAVFTWANYLADRVKLGNVYAIPDSGIFYDFEDIEKKQHAYRQKMANMMKIANAQIDHPVSECVKEHPQEKVNCMFAQNLYKYIKVPMFVTQSVIDSWQIWNVLGVRCSKLEECPMETKQLLEQNRLKVTAILKEIGGNRGNGVFGIGCNLHGLIHTSQYVDEKYTIPSGSDWTAAKAISEWFKNRKGKHTHIDFRPYPSNEGCYFQ